MMKWKAFLFFVILGTTCIGTTVTTAQPAPVIDSNYQNYLYNSRTQYFRALPPVKGAIIFFGDSITHWGDWAELTGTAKALNRGISGDNTFGLLARTDEVIRHNPSKVFILIGTNDINRNLPAEVTLHNYRRIIDRLQQALPRTRLYVQSILPINNDLIGRQFYKGTNEQITALNTGLQQLAREKQVTYVNLYPALLDNKAQMAANYTYDGLHLSGQGYLQWLAVLHKEKYLKK
jgi:lysophospholipase L1-like esterase